MSTRKLLWGMMWRGVAWGSLLGIIFSAFYFALAATWSQVVNTMVIPPANPQPSDCVICFPFTLELVAAALLGVTVTLLGLVSGLALGIITRLFFQSSAYNLSRRKIFMLVSGIVGALAGLSAFNYAFRVSSQTGSDVVFVYFPAITTGIAMVMVGQRLARWYESEIQKQNPSS